MAQSGLLEAIAQAVVMVGHGAEAQTPILSSPKDFVMAASQSDQYEILAAEVVKYKARIHAFEHLLRR